MKYPHLPFAALALLMAFVPAHAQVGSQPTPQLGKTQHLSSADQVPEGLHASDWSSIRAAYEAGRHAVFPREDGTLAARNPGQQWRTDFDGRGFTVKPDAGGWTWGLELKHYGFPGSEQPVAGKASVSHDRSKVHYDWDASLREWFLNDNRGLEQGWTLRERPEGARHGEALQLKLAVRGELRLQVAADGASVSFADADGTVVVNFGGLRAWDADGQTLVTRFETVEGASTVLQLAVEESGARYPITVDPIAQQAYLKASNTGALDYFGLSVSVSGDTVVVGAPLEDSNATGVDGNQADNSAGYSGAAYVFVRGGTTWSQQAYLKASNTGANDYFGRSVSVSGDTVVVGAHGEDSNATGVDGNQADNSAAGSGAAYVFLRGGTTWSQQAYLKASNSGANDQFGYSVSVSGDTVVVGAHYEASNATGVDGNQADNNASDSGAAYVFIRGGTTWSQQAYLKASNTGALDCFGFSVSVSGDTVVVGAFGEDSNATGVDGNQADNSANSSGAAYVFVRGGTNWSQQAYLKASNTGAGDYFGYSVSVSGDTVVVGAHYEDSNATGVDGNQADNSAGDSGAAYVFVRGGTNWSQQAYLKASNSGANDQFGYSVSVSGDTVVVGARYEASNATGVDGNQADNSAGEAGAAYVFMRGGTTWSQQAYLKASNTGGDDWFGYSVSVSGGTVVVGAHGEDSNATGVDGNQADNSAGDSGAAYVFLAPPLQPEIVVEQPLGVDIADGGTGSFGGLPVGNSHNLTFTIRNIGEGNLTGLTITKDGANAADFTVTTSPVAPVWTGNDTSLVVEFTPANAGPKTAAIHIASNDDNENPFDITLTGRGLTTSGDHDGDGMNDVAEYEMAIQGWDWEVAQPALVDNLMSNASLCGLYTESQVQALNVGTPLLVRDPATGEFTLTIGVEKSTDLIQFNPFPMTAPQTTINGAGELEFQFSVPDDTAFFRLESR